MSADLLREAAALMRQRAEAATPGPWRHTDSEAVYDAGGAGLVVVDAERDPLALIADGWHDGGPGETAPIHDADHIASWHPAVALSVADWLENVGEDWATTGPAYVRLEFNAARLAVAVARAYLGRES